MIFNSLQEKREHRRNFFIPSTSSIKTTNKLSLVLIDHQKLFPHLKIDLFLDLNAECLQTLVHRTLKHVSLFWKANAKTNVIQWIKTFFITLPQLFRLTCENWKAH